MMKLLLLVLGALTLGGCIAPRKLSYEASELRTVLSGKIAEEDVVILFEVAPRHVAMARRATSPHRSVKENARDLVEAMFDPDLFGLRYAPVLTTTALETLRTRKGNCLSLAAVYVGLARAIGLEAHFLDATRRMEEEVDKNEDLRVKTGHVTAQVRYPNGEVILYVGGEVDQDVHLWLRRHFLRSMDDLEATAHFYNNRGYEQIHDSLSRNQPVDWARAARDFRLATRVDPGFEPAWNNLGVAHSRLGREEEAIRCYQKALALDPDSESARANLELLGQLKR